jgi:hypothetical protein
MIRLATAALTHVLGLKKAGQYQDALQEIDQALDQLTGLRSNLINSMEDDSLLALFNGQNGPDLDRMLLVAELLKEEGDLFALEGNREQSLLRYNRALILYLEVALGGGPDTYSEPDAKIEAVLKLCEGRPLRAETWLTLYAYFEQVCSFDRAENAINAYLAASEQAEDILAERRDFYLRLLEKSDQDLEGGGLPRQTVEIRLKQEQG